MTPTWQPTAAEVVAGHDLRGRTAIVTGGASGLGAETVCALAGAGAHVVLAARDASRGVAAARRLAAGTPGTVEFDLLDLSTLASVRAFTQRHRANPVHILINNAGIMATPLAYTVDGFESQFGTNHLGHFALTVGLLPALRAGSARVVALSSRGHRRSDVDFADPHYRRRDYDPWQAYGQSKTANALFAVGLTRRYGAEGVTGNAVMPGAIHTGLQRHLTDADLVQLGWTERAGTLVAPASWRTPELGAATSVWAAVAPELEGRGGLYLEDCAVGEPWTTDGVPPNGYYLPYALNPDRAERLWALSEKLVEGN